MEKVLKLIEEKQESYREFRKGLLHDSLTAKKLGFMREVERIEADRKWAMDIIDLLQEVSTIINKT
jgi:hypothetical protein